LIGEPPSSKAGPHLIFIECEVEETSSGRPGYPGVVTVKQVISSDGIPSPDLFLAITLIR